MDNSRQPHIEDGEEIYPLLGFDISDTKIGIAWLEHAGSMPQPLFTYGRLTRARDLEECRVLVTRYGARAIVVGLPLNMDGSSGPRVEWMRRFARHLHQAVGVQVFLQDERLSTAEAVELLTERGLNAEERAECVDAVAAALILERFQAERSKKARHE